MGLFSKILSFVSWPRASRDGAIEFDRHEVRILPPSEQRMRWDHVHRIVAYKIDLLTYDEIRIRLESADERAVVVSEESPGFDAFMDELVLRYPMASDWHAKVSQPPFAESRTIIFDLDQAV